MIINRLVVLFSLILLDTCTNGLDLNEIRDQATGLREMLENYYSGKKGILTATLGYKPNRDDYQDGIDYIAKKMVRKIALNEKFVIAAMGSSVIAGHDNCMFDSYTSQLERLIGPIFDLASGLEVRNAGITGHCGDTHENNIFCFNHLLGDNVDIAHYEWTYMEHGASGKYHEMFIRWAMMNGAVGQIISVNGRGKKGWKECEAAIDDKGAGEKILNNYGKYGINLICMGYAHYMLGYEFKWGKIGDGLHNTTRYGEGSSVDPKRRDSLGVVYRNWHPGPLGFQLLSDILGYYYTEALLRAVDMIEQHQNDNVLELNDESTPFVDIKDMPIPVYCDRRFCNYMPKCMNMEKPTYGNSLIKILEPWADDNPDKDLVDEKDLGWAEYSENPDKRLWGPSEEKNKPECAHVDHCAAIKGTGKSGWLTFSIPPLDSGAIWVCRLKHSNEFKMAQTEFRLNGVPMENVDGKKAFGSKICLWVQRGWEDGNKIDGPLYLSIKVPDNLFISHLIAV